jgi:thiamine biosynthesis lipoprotein
MGRLLAVWLVGVMVTTAPAAGEELWRFEFTRMEMAVPIKLVLYATDEATANGAAEGAFQRFRELNQIFSDYDPKSETRALGAASGEGKSTPVSDEMFEVLGRARCLSERTGGAFDVTIGPLVRLWRRARRQRELPHPERLNASRHLVGYELVRMDADRKTIELTRKGMRLDFGGVAKGYAIDQALAAVRRHGITRALIDAGGDIGLGDPPPDKPGWVIGVAPLEAGAKPSFYLSVSGLAIATSGDTWQFVQIDGRRYSHLVDPRSGLALTDHSSVTVIAPDCTTADSLASAVSVLGPEKGLELIEKTPGTAAYIVRAPEGEVETHESASWKALTVVEP